MLSKETKVNKWLILNDVDVITNGEEVFYSVRDISNLFGYKGDKYVRNKLKKSGALYSSEQLKLPFYFIGNNYFTNAYGLSVLAHSSRKKEIEPLRNKSIKATVKEVVVDSNINLNTDNLLGDIKELKRLNTNIEMEFNSKNSK